MIIARAVLMEMSLILQDVRSMLTIQLIIIAFRGSIRSAPRKRPRQHFWTSTTKVLLLISHTLTPTTIARAISRNDVPYRA